MKIVTPDMLADSLDSARFELPKSRKGATNGNSTDVPVAENIKPVEDHYTTEVFTAQSCERRGAFYVGQVPKIKPKGYAADHLADGTAFERLMFVEHNEWLLPKIKEHIDFVSEPEKHDLDNVDIETAKARIKGYEAAGTPVLLYQVRIELPLEQAKLLGAKKALMGVVDFLIFDGKRWHILDTKRTVNASSIYGLQLTMYFQILNSYTSRLSDTGYLIVCSPSHQFYRSDSLFRRRLALENTILQALPFKYFTQEVTKFYALGSDGNVADHDFTSQCIECGFRSFCYINWYLHNELPVSALNLEEGEIEALKERGIRTVVQLENDLAGLKEIVGREDVYAGIMQRMAQVRQIGGLFEWRSGLNWRGNYLVFAHDDSAIKYKFKWVKPDGTVINEITPEFAKVHIESVSVVFTYSPIEARLAEEQLWRLKIYDVAVIPLLDQIRKHTHLPYPSYSVEDVLWLLEGINSGHHVTHIYSAAYGGLKRVFSDTPMDDTKKPEMCRKLVEVLFSLEEKWLATKKPQFTKVEGGI